jgi:hypothetical protein
VTEAGLPDRTHIIGGSHLAVGPSKLERFQAYKPGTAAAFNSQIL